MTCLVGWAAFDPDCAPRVSAPFVFCWCRVRVDETLCGISCGNRPARLKLLWLCQLRWPGPSFVTALFQDKKSRGDTHLILNTQENHLTRSKSYPYCAQICRINDLPGVSSRATLHSWWTTESYRCQSGLSQLVNLPD